MARGRASGINERQRGSMFFNQGNGKGGDHFDFVKKIILVSPLTRDWQRARIKPGK